MRLECPRWRGGFIAAMLDSLGTVADNRGDPMRNVAISSDANFAAAHQWARGDLPITLQWRSTLWRYIVPPLWVLGWAFWIWVVSVRLSGTGFILQALLFIGIPLILAATAAWWVSQMLHKRTSGKIVINDDYLEWQFETESKVDLLADCGRFEFAGKRDYEARIEWDMATPGEDTADGWPNWSKHWRVADWIRSDRTLYGRDAGLDRGDLESLCKLLNQLREEAKAHR